MNWNYRIVKYKNGSGFGLHEVFYNKEGATSGITESPVKFAGDTPQAIREDLELALRDVSKNQLLVEPDVWAKGGV